MDLLTGSVCCVSAGETAVFSCATDMAHQGLTASWLKDNKPISGAMADRCAQYVSSVILLTLSLETIEATPDGVLFLCI